MECRVNSSKYPQFLTVLTREFNIKFCYRSNLRDFHVNTNYTEQQGQPQPCLLNRYLPELTKIKIVQTEKIMTNQT